MEARLLQIIRHELFVASIVRDASVKTKMNAAVHLVQ